MLEEAEDQEWATRRRSFWNYRATVTITKLIINPSNLAGAAINKALVDAIRCLISLAIVIATSSDPLGVFIEFYASRLPAPQWSLIVKVMDSITGTDRRAGRGEEDICRARRGEVSVLVFVPRSCNSVEPVLLARVSFSPYMCADRPDERESEGDRFSARTYDEYTGGYAPRAIQRVFAQILSHTFAIITQLARWTLREGREIQATCVRCADIISQIYLRN